MSWQPDKASAAIEANMERYNLPASTRDELRRFAEVLKRRKARRDLDAVGGGPLPPAPAEMIDWLTGKDMDDRGDAR